MNVDADRLIFRSVRRQQGKWPKLNDQMNEIMIGVFHCTAGRAMTTLQVSTE
jgi:hypothetical protein